MRGSHGPHSHHAMHWAAQVPQAAPPQPAHRPLGAQALQQPAQPRPSAIGEGAALPPGWEAATSRSTGETYYVHTATNHSTFERPPALAAEHAAPQVVAPPALASREPERSASAREVAPQPEPRPQPQLEPELEPEPEPEPEPQRSRTSTGNALVRPRGLPSQPAQRVVKTRPQPALPSQRTPGGGDAAGGGGGIEDFQLRPWLGENPWTGKRKPSRFLRQKPHSLSPPRPRPRGWIDRRPAKYAPVHSAAPPPSAH